MNYPNIAYILEFVFNLRSKFQLKISKNKSEKTKYPKLNPLWAGIFADILGFTMFIPLLPSFVEDFGATEFQVGLLLSVNALFAFIFGPYLGKLSDKYGRRPLLFISQAGTFVGFIIFAFSKNLTMLYISRIVDGIFGGNFPIAKAVIGDVVHPKDRSLAMSNVGVAHNLANLFGPALGGLLVERFDIVGPGLFAAGLALFSMVQTAFYLEESAPAIISKKIENWDKTILDKPNTTKSSEAHLEKSIKGNKSAIVLLIQWGLHTLAFMSVISGVTLFGFKKLNINERDIGVIFSITGAFQIFIRYVVFYPMLKKIGELKTAKIGLMLFIPTFFIIGFVNETYQFIIILLVMSFAASSVRGVLTGLLSRSIDKSIMGKVMGYSSSLDSVAQISGPLLSTTALTVWSLNFYGFIPAILSIGAFTLVFYKFELKDYSQENNHKDALTKTE
ncbi:MAG: MFS transporter [Candidatus Lokiarchaeota archaeon]|nr:MFS transporter [Candidatus Lokiarchaeota archaeon]